MKVVFLDFDGTLNCGVGDPTPEHVTRLNRVVTSVSPWAVVVVSSNWRLNRSVEELHDILTGAGFIGAVLDKTPILNESLYGGIYRPVARGVEIRRWLQDFGVPASECVILDDEDDMGPLRSRLVQTVHWQGLSDADADRAIKLLQESVLTDGR